MKTNRFFVIGITLSLAMSGISLALQVKKEPIGFFAKYSKPYPVTDLEWRMLIFHMEAIREHLPYHNGLRVPTFRRFSNDYSTAVIRVMVSEQSMPSQFADRKQRLQQLGISTMVTMQSAFPDLPDSGIEVEFFDPIRSLRTSGSDKDKEAAGVMAIYKHPELIVK